MRATDLMLKKPPLLFNSSFSFASKFMAHFKKHRLSMMMMSFSFIVVPLYYVLKIWSFFVKCPFSAAGSVRRRRHTRRNGRGPRPDWQTPPQTASDMPTFTLRRSIELIVALRLILKWHVYATPPRELPDKTTHWGIICSPPPTI